MVVVVSGTAGIGEYGDSESTSYSRLVAYHVVFASSVDCQRNGSWSRTCEQLPSLGLEVGSKSECRVVLSSLL